MPQRKLAHLGLLTPAADKTKSEIVSTLQLERRAEQRVERMTRTVIPRIHDNKSIAQSVLPSKRFPARN